MRGNKWQYCLATKYNRITRDHLGPKGTIASAAATTTTTTATTTTIVTTKPTERFSNHWYLHVSQHTEEI